MSGSFLGVEGRLHDGTEPWPNLASCDRSSSLARWGLVDSCAVEFPVGNRIRSSDHSGVPRRSTTPREGGGSTSARAKRTGPPLGPQVLKLQYDEVLVFFRDRTMLCSALSPSSLWVLVLPRLTDICECRDVRSELWGGRPGGGGSAPGVGKVFATNQGLRVRHDPVPGAWNTGKGKGSSNNNTTKQNTFRRRLSSYNAARAWRRAYSTMCWAGLGGCWLVCYSQVNKETAPLVLSPLRTPIDAG